MQNDCFVNVVLQMLFHIPPIIKKLQEDVVFSAVPRGKEFDPERKARRIFKQLRKIFKNPDIPKTELKKLMGMGMRTAKNGETYLGRTR